MTTAGHNNPPAEEAFGLHIDELFSLLSDTLAGGPVETDEQEAAIDALSKDFLKAKQDADKARAAEKKPHDDAAKAVQTKWKPIVDKASRGQGACNDALTPYRVAKQRAKEEAARKAREEAEERQRKAQEALRQSEDLEQRFEAEQDLEAAKKLNAVANKIDRGATGLRTLWTAEITNRDDALRHYLRQQPEAFIALIRELADRDARGARPQVPGVTYHEQKKAA
ncbi:hypothetical protein [Novosphingobium sp. ZW T3_23]|uniref:hypothetical protein n=1 Tax=Novosphingobium sp. ZW T3_23 TaxID=3378084 RepID=UPI00385534FE